MNISKDGKILYFSDEEISNNINGEKKVFVTKRINGKETHEKAETREKNIQKEEKNNYKNPTINKEVTLDLDFLENYNDTYNKKEDKKENKKDKSQKKHSNNKKNKTSKKKSSNKNSRHSYKKNKKKSYNHYKKKSHKALISIVTSIILILIVCVIALTAPIFNIVKIEVSGNEQISSDTIISLSGLKKGENIFKINNQVIENIKENNYIESVTIKKELPGTVEITVTERVVKYQIKIINGYSYIDQNGYLLENSTEKKDVPIIVGLSITEEQALSNKKLESADLETLNNIYKIIEASKNIEIEDLITEVNVEEANDYVLYLESENKSIHIGDTSNLTNKMLYVQTMLENEVGISGSIFVNGDLNQGFKPYFREE